MNNRNKNFTRAYENSYARRISDFKKKYPEITKKSRRTGKALKNISFFIRHYAKEECDETIDLLFKSSVLLSAQDNFLDNVQISEHHKKEFHYVLKNLLEEKKHPIEIRHTQSQELIALWKELIRKTKSSSSHLYSYWKKKVYELNKAMEDERYLMKKRGITFDEYMETAINSVGSMFIWATYLAKKDIPVNTLVKLEPVLSMGAKIARLSNDIASHRQGKNRINAVRVLKHKKDPIKYLTGLVKRERGKLLEELKKLEGEHEVVGVVQRSIEFLIGFYNKSDFDK